MDLWLNGPTRVAGVLSLHVPTVAQAAIAAARAKSDSAVSARGRPRRPRLPVDYGDALAVSRHSIGVLTALNE